MVSAVPLPFSQESVVAAFQALCYSVSWAGFKFPMVEDLLLDPCFSSFHTWRSNNNSLLPGMPAGPRVVSLSERSMFRMTLGVQTGAGASGKAAPPLVPFGLGADGHFAAASEFRTLGTPFEHDPLVDDDLWFASEQTALHYGRARTERERVSRVLTELGRRWQPVTDHLRSCQPWEVAKATAGRHLGLLGLLGLLLDWPDPTFMHDLLVGFPSIGFSPHVPSFTSQQGQWITWDNIWETSYSDALRILTSLKPGPLDSEIVQAGEKDEQLFHGETFYGLTAPLGSSGVFVSSKGTNAESSTTQMTADSRRSVVTLTNWTFARQFNRVFTSVFSTKHSVLNMPPGMHVLTLLSQEVRICHTLIEAYL